MIYIYNMNSFCQQNYPFVTGCKQALLTFLFTLILLILINIHISFVNVSNFFKKIEIYIPIYTPLLIPTIRNIFSLVLLCYYEYMLTFTYKIYNYINIKDLSVNENVSKRVSNRQQVADIFNSMVKSVLFTGIMQERYFQRRAERVTREAQRFFRWNLFGGVRHLLYARQNRIDFQRTNKYCLYEKRNTNDY
jgi:hypothetical protein